MKTASDTQLGTDVKTEQKFQNSGSLLKSILKKVPLSDACAACVDHNLENSHSGKDCREDCTDEEMRMTADALYKAQEAARKQRRSEL